MAWLRRGDWRPTRGTWLPVLLVIQLLGLGQALLRGAAYVRTHYTTSELAALTPPPLWVWGMLFAGFAIAGLVGIAGRWGSVVAVGHCGVALAYLSVGVALLGAAPVQEATGQLVAAGIHGALGLSVLRIVTRQKIRAAKDGT